MRRGADSPAKASTPPRAGAPGTSRTVLAAVALVAVGFVPPGETARADHGGPHDPDVVVTAPRPPGLDEFCIQNPITRFAATAAEGGC